MNLLVREWRWQFGLAITLPWFGKAVILVRSMREWDSSPKLRAHESCHAHQIEAWGGGMYIWRQVAARIRASWKKRRIDLWAAEEPEEKPCYEAGR